MLLNDQEMLCSFQRPGNVTFCYTTRKRRCVQRPGNDTFCEMLRVVKRPGNVTFCYIPGSLTTTVGTVLESLCRVSDKSQSVSRKQKVFRSFMFSNSMGN